MHTHSLRELSLALQQHVFSSVELTRFYLKRIDEHQALNAFIHVDAEAALHSAAAADKMIQAGKGHALTGIPMAHKDLFCTATLPTTCASRMLAEFQSPYQATMVERFSQVGAVLIGKTNMDEFAMGSSNEHSYFGSVQNPWDTTRVPGGSSGGSAAAVAARIIPFATGSDTGGSIRQPAAFCGISGLKPTYGLVSRFGMTAFASSLDQAGPMARSAEDLAFILEVMAGYDARDSTSVNRPVPRYSDTLHEPPEVKRIGLPACFLDASQTSPDIQIALSAAVSVFKDKGFEIIPVDLSMNPLWVSCYYVIACAEAASNLARYDGVRFGHRTSNAETLALLIQRSRDEGFGMEVKRRILTGTYVLSEGYFDEYYVQAQKVRRLIQAELLKVLSEVDVILGPTTPTAAFKLGRPPASPPERYLADVFTVAANLAGLPALSIPAGFNHEGLPVGIQMMGKPFSEQCLLQLAHAYQSVTNWHQACPEVFV